MPTIDGRQFDPEAYFQHYYGEPHPDDERVIRLRGSGHESRRRRSTRSWMSSMSALVQVSFHSCARLPRARRLTAWEYAERQYCLAGSWNYSRKEMRLAMASLLAMSPAKAYAAGLSACLTIRCPSLREKSTDQTEAQSSIFPERHMGCGDHVLLCGIHYRATRTSSKPHVAAYARCVKRGGALAAAFLAHSAGYIVKASRFPALPLSAESILKAFAPHAEGLKAEAIGIVQREVRSGYSGLVFLTGNAR